MIYNGRFRLIRFSKSAMNRIYNTDYQCVFI